MQNQIPIFNSSDDLEYIDGKKILGEGAFSEVVKVRNKNDNKFYALKKINLLKLSKADRDHLKNETSLHTSLDHKNIIKFMSSLQEENMVYFLLEYATNGCLFFYIHSRNGLPEMIALRYAYQTALAIKYLHDRNIIHRDIKPENILLDENFDVKLCDFGWSCETEKGRARTTLCGTYEYMSPEIIFLSKHNNKVDIWCLGILLYEMLHGNPPFSAESIGDMRKEFSTKGIKINKNLSTDTKDLLKALLKRKEENRLTIDEVIDQPAFVNNIEEFKKPINKNEFEILVKNFLINSGGGRNRTLPDSILNNKNISSKIQSVKIPFYGENQNNPVVNNNINKLGQFNLNDLKVDNLTSGFGQQIINKGKSEKTEDVKKDKEKLQFKLGPITNEKKEEENETKNNKINNSLQQKEDKKIEIKKVLKINKEKINNKNFEISNVKKFENEKVKVNNTGEKINKLPKKVDTVVLNNKNLKKQSDKKQGNLYKIIKEKQVKVNKIPLNTISAPENTKKEIKENNLENKIVLNNTKIVKKIEKKNFVKIDNSTNTVKKVENIFGKNQEKIKNSTNLNKTVNNIRSNNQYVQKKIITSNINKKNILKYQTNIVKPNSDLLNNNKIQKNDKIQEQKNEKKAEPVIKKKFFKIDHFKDKLLNQNTIIKQNSKKLIPEINKIQSNFTKRIVINKNLDKKIKISGENKVKYEAPKRVVYLTRYSSMKDLSRKNNQSNFTSSKNIQTFNTNKNYIDLYSSNFCKKNKTSINKKKNPIRRLTVKSRNSFIKSTSNLHENNLNNNKSLIFTNKNAKNPIHTNSNEEKNVSKIKVLKEFSSINQKINKNVSSDDNKNDNNQYSNVKNVYNNFYTNIYNTNIYEKDKNQRKNTDFSKKDYTSKFDFNNNFVKEKTNQKVEGLIPFEKKYSTQSLSGIKRNNYQANNLKFSNQPKFENEYGLKNKGDKSERNSKKINGLIVRRYRI